MSNQCINYKFCKGLAFPELEINTCLLCGKWYEFSEGWDELEFVTDDEITVKYYHNKEWKYFNTINLSLYQK